MNDSSLMTVMISLMGWSSSRCAHGIPLPHQHHPPHPHHRCANVEQWCWIWITQSAQWADQIACRIRKCSNTPQTHPLWYMVFTWIHRICCWMCFIPGAQNILWYDFHIVIDIKIPPSSAFFQRSKHMMCLGKYKRQKEIKVFAVLTFAHLIRWSNSRHAPWMTRWVCGQFKR